MLDVVACTIVIRFEGTTGKSEAPSRDVEGKNCGWHADAFVRRRRCKLLCSRISGELVSLARAVTMYVTLHQ